jgi:hypothetical protein
MTKLATSRNAGPQLLTIHDHFSTLKVVVLRVCHTQPSVWAIQRGGGLKENMVANMDTARAGHTKFISRGVVTAPGICGRFRERQSPPGGKGSATTSAA